MLFRGGVAAGTEQNWYLRSEIKSAGESRPIYRPGVALYGAVPSLARELAVQQIGTFHDRRGNEERFGDRRAAGRAPGATISEGSGGMAGSSFSGNTYGMQAGQDLYARTSDSGHQDRYGVFLLRERQWRRARGRDGPARLPRRQARHSVPQRGRLLDSRRAGRLVHRHRHSG